MPDFSPWYCSTCQSMVPASTLTHWIDLNDRRQTEAIYQHSVHPPGSGPVTRPKQGLGTRVPARPPEVVVYGRRDDSAEIYVQDADGRLLARVEVHEPKHMDGRPLPELIARLEAALALAYYDQIES